MGTDQNIYSEREDKQEIYLKSMIYRGNLHNMKFKITKPSHGEIYLGSTPID